MAATTMGMTELFEQFGVLSRQEDGAYVCHDYLSPDYQIDLERKTPTQSKGNIAPSSATSSCSSAASSNSGGINEVWREKICEWTFQVIDHFDFNREVASISLNYLDRYLSTRMVNRKMFQLAAMTSLFLAVKLYEPTTLKMSSFVELSRGYFKTEHIGKMESSILWTLSWHVHPPTPLGFVRNYVLLLEKSGSSPAVTLEVNEVARFLTELSICDYYFTTRKPSSTGLGAVLAAFERFDENTLPLRVQRTFLKLVRSMEVIDPFSDEVQGCKSRLSATYHQDESEQEEHSEVVQAPSGAYEQQPIGVIEAPRDAGRFSPDCVADVDSSYSSRKRCCNRT